VSVEDGESSGQPNTSEMTENVENIREVIHIDHHQIINELTDAVGSRNGVRQEIFNRILEHVPHCHEVCSTVLENNQQQRHVVMCFEL
jgi:hypothetical protein